MQRRAERSFGRLDCCSNKIREKIQDFPILCGSGVNTENIATLFKYANGAIVSTSLKEGKVDSKEINIKPYSQRIDRQKVIDLVKKIQSL